MKRGRKEEEEDGASQGTALGEIKGKRRKKTGSEQKLWLIGGVHFLFLDVAWYLFQSEQFVSKHTAHSVSKGMTGSHGAGEKESPVIFQRFNDVRCRKTGGRLETAWLRLWAVHVQTKPI